MLSCRSLQPVLAPPQTTGRFCVSALSFSSSRCVSSTLGNLWIIPGEKPLSSRFVQGLSMQQPGSGELRHRGGPRSSAARWPAESERDKGVHPTTDTDEDEGSNPCGSDSEGVQSEADSDEEFQSISQFEKRLLAETPPLQKEGIPKYSLLLVRMLSCGIALYLFVGGSLLSLWLPVSLY